jgi:hypothetical protein
MGSRFLRNQIVEWKSGNERMDLVVVKTDLFANWPA